MKTELTLVSAEEKARFEQDGFLVKRGLFGPAEIADIRDKFMQFAEGPLVNGLFEPVNAAGENDPLKRYPRVMQPHRHQDLPIGKLAMRYMLDARIGSVLTALFDEEPAAAQTMFYYKPAGARGQALHQDNFYLRVAPGTCMAAWLAVDDADEENGTLMVVPGSHRTDIVCPELADRTQSFTTHYVPVPDGFEQVPVLLKAGDTLFFNGSLIHGSYPNVSRDRFRRSFISHYLPKASTEIGKWYQPIYDFGGGTIDNIAIADGAGPCGTEFATEWAH
jgi:ectoine hydroxylase-related dioxygenase (phytanoyl-CoA dioxygenase family)